MPFRDVTVYWEMRGGQRVPRPEFFARGPSAYPCPCHPAAHRQPPLILAGRDAADTHARGRWDLGPDPASAHRTHSALQPATSAASLSVSLSLCVCLSLSLTHTRGHNAQGLFLSSSERNQTRPFFRTKFFPTSLAAVTQDLAC